ncbi:histamine H2 receptor-like [Clytia hemisphaerica]|uniref:histamine H2 receptor-like n=1 Tax=Clytia hemisphaerica TaxID=252671 RepID=UPI0034D42924
MADKKRFAEEAKQKQIDAEMEQELKRQAQLKLQQQQNQEACDVMESNTEFTISMNSSFIFGTIFTLMTPIGCFGNIASIICLQKKSRLQRTKIDSLLKSLLVSDLLVSLTVYPLSAYLQFTRYRDVLSTLANVVLLLSLTSISSVTVVFLAVIKYIKMSRFTSFDRIITKIRLKIMIATSWVVPIGVISPYLVSSTYNAGIFTMITCLSTLIILPIFYYRIHRIHKESSDRIHHSRNHEPGQLNHISPTSQRVIKRVLCLVGAYFVCSAPMIPSMILYRSGVITNNLLPHFVLMLFAGNSCINPTLFLLTDSGIRKMKKRFFNRSLTVPQKIEQTTTHV